MYVFTSLFFTVCIVLSQTTEIRPHYYWKKWVNFYMYNESVHVGNYFIGRHAHGEDVIVGRLRTGESFMPYIYNDRINYGLNPEVLCSEHINRFYWHPINFKSVRARTNHHFVMGGDIHGYPILIGIESNTTQNPRIGSIYVNPGKAGLYTVDTILTFATNYFDNHFYALAFNDSGLNCLFSR